MSEVESEYLTFVLDEKNFGVDILCVQEIRAWSPVTELPNLPDYIKGVIKLRRNIIPIVDLRERFAFGSLEDTSLAVTIILKAWQDDRQIMVGIVVDAVSDVYKFSSEAIEQPPDLGSHIDIRFIAGIASVDEDLIVLLNTKTLLDDDELGRATSQIKQAS